MIHEFKRKNHCLTSPRLSRDAGSEETLARLVRPPVPMVKEDILLWARRPDGTRPFTVPASLWEYSLLVSVSLKGRPKIRRQSVVLQKTESAIYPDKTKTNK